MISNATSNSTANLYTAPLSGVERGVQKMDEASGKIAAGDLSPATVGSDIEAARFVQANAVSLRTADRMVGTLINTVA